MVLHLIYSLLLQTSWITKTLKLELHWSTPAFLVIAESVQVQLLVMIEAHGTIMFFCASRYQSLFFSPDPMDCRTPGFPVHHQCSGLAQAHVHPVGDAIQSSSSLSSPSPPAFNLSQHQVFSSESVPPTGGQSIGFSALVSVFPMNIQDWFPLGLTGWISLQSKGLSRVLSNQSLVPKSLGTAALKDL